MIAFSSWVSSALVILCYAAKLPEYVTGTPIDLSSAKQVICKSANSLECHDCTRMRVCDSRKTIATITECGGATPYCNKNKCSAIPDQNECRDNVLCPRANRFFPKPSNCREYYYCDHMRMAIQYQCPAKYVYDAKAAFCKAVSPQHTCVEIDCNLPANKFQIIGYPTDSAIYAYCDTNRTITFLCDEDEQFEKESLSCEFACVKEGYFAYKNDCKKYNACFLNSNDTFSKVVVECPPGMLFNPKIRSCDIEYKNCPSTNDDIETTEKQTTLPVRIYESISMKQKPLNEHIEISTIETSPDFNITQISSNQLTNQYIIEEEPLLA